MRFAGLTGVYLDGRVVDEVVGGLEGAGVAREEGAVELPEVGDDDDAVDPPADEALGWCGGVQKAGAAAGLAVADALLHPLRHLLEAVAHPVAVEATGVKDAEAVPHGPQHVVFLQAQRPPVLVCPTQLQAIAEANLSSKPQFSLELPEKSHQKNGT